MDFDDARPIWLQLIDEFRRRIAVGEWASGTRIPSVRELAVELGVNPNTVQRALVELDRLGLTASERTAGRFVTTGERAVNAVRSELAAEVTDAYIAQLRGLAMTLNEAAAVLQQRWHYPKEETDGRN